MAIEQDSNEPQKRPPVPATAPVTATSLTSLGLPDLARGREFYGTVLGWRFSPGSSEHGAQVDDIVPMIGLWDGEAAGDGRVHGAVLAFRVDDLATAVAAVRAHGGTISDPHQEPYALAAEAHDDQGIPFSRHEMPSILGDGASADGGFHNGEIAGDVSYLTMVVTDLDAAHGSTAVCWGGRSTSVGSAAPRSAG